MPGPYPRDSEVIWVFLEAHRQCCLQITTKQEPTVQYISDLENTGMRPRVEVVQNTEEHRDTNVGIQNVDTKMFLYRLKETAL